MIISSAPLRVSFNGGGSDLPSFFAHEEGFTVTASLKQSVHVMINKSFYPEYRIAYSRLERTKSRSEISHPIVRSVLEILGCDDFLEIASVADVPSTGSGLGTSSAFTVALLNGIASYMGKSISPKRLAELACEVEINMCKSPIGKQDQYASAFGGVSQFYFKSNESVEHTELIANEELESQLVNELNKHSLFFHIDVPRQTNDILEKQNNKLRELVQAREIVTSMVDLAHQSSECLKDGNIRGLGKLLTAGWMKKMDLNGDSDSTNMKGILDLLLTSNAHGGKLLGAGVGGFLFVLANEQDHGEIARKFSQLKRVKFEFASNRPVVRSV